MNLLPIDLDVSRNLRFASIPECVEVLKVYPGYYDKVRFNPPWIGYFVADDSGTIVGTGGYKGQPRQGTVEIAYGTFSNFRRKGMGTEICRQLVQLAQKTDSGVRITARTLPENNESSRILKRNGFVFAGTVYDEEDGNVWEWEFGGFPEQP